LRGGSRHAVQFYDTEDELFGVVSDFLLRGLRAGGPAIVIATPEHTAAFVAAMSADEFDVRAAIEAGQLTLLDAHDTLASFRAGDELNERRFREIIGSVLERAEAGWRGTAVHAYGEMVDLLWREGLPENAIRLEEFWNHLAQTHNFSLLCGYPANQFLHEAQKAQFERTRALHDSVIERAPASLAAEVERRKELEKTLRDALSARSRAERELKDFVENAPIGLHWVGADGTILWANQAELDLLGYRREEYIGRNITDFYADRTLIEGILERLSRGEVLRDVEARLKAKDGSIRDVMISSNVLFEGGRFIHTRCFTRDITEKKKAREDAQFLAEASEMLSQTLDSHTLLENVTQLFVPRVCDWAFVDLGREDGGFSRTAVAIASIDDRPLAARLARSYPGETLLGRAQESAAAVMVANEIDDPLLMTIGRNSEDLATLRAMRIRCLMRVPLIARGITLGFLTLAGTRTKSKFSDRDATLAQEVARRAAMALDNARLYESAQNANRAKDEFLATLSHELRTPLTAILGWSRFLRTGHPEPETIANAMDAISRAAVAQAQLIDDVLDMSRIISGKLRLEIRAIDLANVVDAAIETVSPAISAKNIKLEVERDPSVGIVWADPNRLQQAIWNLLTNSTKFTEAGGTITVSIKRSGSVTQIVVSDTGQGIEPDFLPYVFERFRQAQSATTREFGGLGLGLAIVRYIVEMHGGRVTAESDGPGKGARFTIELPTPPEARASSFRPQAVSVA
jgi:PAS domain S-box-containing protein